MKIFEIIPHLHSGGGEKFVVDLSNELSLCGNDCTIVTLFDPSADDTLRAFISKGVKVLSLNKKSGADLGCMIRLAKLIHREKPDIVHSHIEATTYSFVSSILCKSRFFATLHSEASREATGGIHKLFRKIAFRLGLITPITISKESEKSFECFYGYPTVMIPNGSCPYLNVVTTDDYSKYRKGVDSLFVHAGRIHKVKNQLLLVKTFDELVKRGKNVRLVIAGRVGDKACFSEIEPYLNDNIVYVGEIADTRALIKEADAFCLSSNMEGMPITIIEAFSVGCPVIATPVGGCVNMIKSGQNGFLSASNELADFISTLETFLDLSENNKSLMRSNAKDSFFKEYSIQICSKRYLELFKK